jgi:hypothetical protein
MSAGRLKVKTIIRRYECSAAHHAGGLSKKTRKHMDDLHDWSDPVDQLAISLSILFEFPRFLSE